MVSSSECPACRTLCSEIQALATLASEFIAVGRAKQGAASVFRLQTAVREYRKHVRGEHAGRSLANLRPHAAVRAA
jgi:hypothetical protein